MHCNALQVLCIGAKEVIIIIFGQNCYCRNREKYRLRCYGLRDTITVKKKTDIMGQHFHNKIATQNKSLLYLALKLLQRLILIHFFKSLSGQAWAAHRIQSEEVCSLTIQIQIQIQIKYKIQNTKYKAKGSAVSQYKRLTIQKKIICFLNKKHAHFVFVFLPKTLVQKINLPY